MHLLAPLYAAGLALCVVPILIHLFGRDRAPKRRFFAARLLDAAQRQRAPRARLEQWLLVLLRVLAVAAIALVLSRPMWDEASRLPVAAGLQQSAVVILDDSLSMNRRDHGKRLYDLGRKDARLLVRAFAEGSEVAILGTSGAERDPLPLLEKDRGRVTEALDAATSTTRAGSSTSALARAAAILSGASLPLRRVYLISDLAAHGFAPKAPRPFEAGEVGLTVLPVGQAPLANDAVVSVTVTPSSDRGLRRLRVNARVRSDARASHTRTVSLSFEGRTVARGVIDLPRDGAVDKIFEYVVPPDTEPRVAEVVLDLDAEDTLTIDDIRSAPVAGSEARALLVDGAPGVSRREDETFYLETALRASRGQATSIEVVPEDELARVDLAQFAVVFLCNPRPSPALGTLQAFVEHGGGLFVSVGDNLEPIALSQQLAALLPSAFEGTRDLTGPGGVAGGALRFERPSAAALRRLPSLSEEHAAETWRAARSFRVALVRPLPSDASDREILARFEDGSPALLERRVGRGRVITLTTSIDRGYSDLAIQPIFPPLMVDIADHLSARAGHTLDHELVELDVTESDPTLLPDRDKLATPPPSEPPVHPPGRELWHALAVVLLLLLFFESLLGLRG